MRMHLSIFKFINTLLLTLILVNIAAPTAVLAYLEVDLGDFPIPGPDLILSSQYIKAVISFEQNALISQPTLRIIAHGPFPVPSVHRGLVSMNGNTIEIVNWVNQAVPVSGSVSLTPGALQLVAPILLLAFAASKSSRPITSILALIVLLALASSLTHGLSLDQPHVSVVIKVPAGTSLGKVSLSLVDGSVISNVPLSVTSMDIDLCGSRSSTDANVSMNGLIASETVNICARGAVAMSHVLPSSLQVNTSLISLNSSVTALSAYYDGSFHVESSTTTPSVSGQSCTVSAPSTRIRSGTCGTTNRNKFEISAATQALLEVVGCATGFTGDPSVGPNVPSSPAITPTTSRMVYLNKTMEWRARMAWGESPYVNLTQSTIKSGMDLSMAAWAPDIFWLLGQTDLVFRKNVASNFRMTMQPNAQAPTIANMTLILVSTLSTRYWELSTSSYSPDNPAVLWSQTIGGPFSAISAPIDFSITSSIDTVTARLIVKVMYPTRVGVTWNVYFGDMYMDQPVIAPILFQDGSSEVVTLDKMPPTLDPTDIGSCPHNAPGLVHWHNPSIWPGGVMPNPAGTITIPEGQSVLISSCSLLPPPFVYHRIHVPQTSKLIFSDAAISLNIRNIFVEGQLHMGGPSCRLNSKITITFEGEKTLADHIAPRLGSKGIGVGSNGSIDIHGRQYHPTWTRLAATIWPGDDTIYLQDTNNWEVGQTVAIATSLYKDFNDDQNEIRVIKAIENVGKTIQFTEALNFYHYAGDEYQAEVALLSRRIILQGDDKSEKDSFGGHTIVTGEGRFSGIMTYRMGQLNVLGKYPFHFHAMGPSPTSFVRDCSIWNSYFRCIAIHATNESQALRNVAYNATAHCYYLEDGIEESNVINYNLAVKINTIGTPMTGESQNGEVRYSSDDLILPADGAASGFYITNAYNTFVGNAASGGWAGFSFPNLPKPLGLSRGVDIIPQERPTLVFRGNTAHSSGYSFPGGGCIYVGGLLKYLSDDSNVLSYDDGRYARSTKQRRNGPAAWMQFNETKLFMCGIGASHWGERIEVIGLEAHDTGRSVQVFGEAWLTKALVNAKSGNLLPFTGQMGFQFYDTYVKSILTDVQFRGFKSSSPPYDPSSDTNPFYWPDKRVVTSLIHSDYFKPQGISAVTRITFSDCDRSQFVGHKRIETGSARYFNFVDWDGSFGTLGVPQIIGSGNGWWQYDSACIYEPFWFMWRCPKGTRTIINIHYLIPGVIDTNNGELPATPSNHVGQTYLFGPGIPAGRNATLTRNPGVTGPSQIGWYFDHNAGSPQTFTAYQFVNPIGQWIMGAWKYAAGTTFAIHLKMAWSGESTPLSSVATFAEVLNSDGTKYYFDESHLYIKMVNIYDNIAINNFTRGGVSIYDVQNPVYYEVTANCVSASNGWCPSSYIHPTKWT